MALRVVVAADTFPPDVNGAANFAEALSRGLAQRGHEVLVVCPSKTGRMETIALAERLTVLRLTSFRYPWHQSFRFSAPILVGASLRKAMASFGPDLVHAQAHFGVGRSAVRAARSLRLPVVATNHFMPENLLPQLPVHLPPVLARAVVRLAWADARSVMRHADILTAPTPAAAEVVRARAGLAVQRAVSCGVDTNRFHPDAGANVDPPRVVFVGRLEPEKHVDVLLKAFAQVSAPASLRIIGSGASEPLLRGLAADLGIAGKVTFMGSVPAQDLPRELAAAGVFCMPGTVELQSIATLEAMASGLPVVLADSLALPHLVEQGRNGLLFPPGDPTELANALEQVLVDEPRRRQWGARSREIALTHTVDAVVEEFEGLYRTLLAERERSQ